MCEHEGLEIIEKLLKVLQNIFFLSKIQQTSTSSYQVNPYSLICKGLVSLISIQFDDTVAKKSLMLLSFSFSSLLLLYYKPL